MYSEKKKYADLIVDFPGSVKETYTYSLEGNHHVKIGQVVEHEMTPSIEGMINKVKHLITIVE